MTEVSEAAKLKACELANALREELGWSSRRMPQDIAGDPDLEALTRLIQQFSDAAEEALSYTAGSTRRKEVLAPFILPDPVDPLLKVLDELGFVDSTWIKAPEEARRLRQRLAQRGLKVVPVQP